MDRVNGWTVLMVAIVLLMAFGFAMLMMKQFQPAMTAQIAGNQVLCDNINRNFNQYNQDIQKVLTSQQNRIAKLEAKLAAK